MVLNIFCLKILFKKIFFILIKIKSSYYTLKLYAQRKKKQKIDTITNKNYLLSSFLSFNYACKAK